MFRNKDACKPLKPIIEQPIPVEVGAGGGGGGGGGGGEDEGTDEL